MPARPSNITGVQDLLNVINQSVRELHIRIDNLNKQVPQHRIIKTSGLLNFGTIGANATVERNLLIAGAAQSGSASASPQLTLGGLGLQWSSYIPKNGAVTVRLTNTTASPIVVNTVKWNVSITQ